MIDGYGNIVLPPGARCTAKLADAADGVAQVPVRTAAAVDRECMHASIKPFKPEKMCECAWELQH